jgi:hypothetical protein
LKGKPAGLAGFLLVSRLVENYLSKGLDIFFAGDIMMV